MEWEAGKVRDLYVFSAGSPRNDTPRPPHFTVVGYLDLPAQLRLGQHEASRPACPSDRPSPSL